MEFQNYYDGMHPAAGTVSTEWAEYIYPPLQNSEGARDRKIYDQILNQFAVGFNPRYQFREGGYWCNIFLWDVSRAMGAEIPHWITASGDIAAPNDPGSWEINVNSTVDWMLTHGITRFGWKKTSEAVAQASANEGKIAVTLWKNANGGHGHAALIRPASEPDNSTLIAQAGFFNFNSGYIEQGFGADKKDLLFFYHD